MGMVQTLTDAWRRSGVEPGDTLLLHSSIRRTLVQARRQGDRLEVQDILDSFLEALGPRGTLLLPLFNFDFTTGVPFDIRSTPSRMGALTEAGRLRDGAVRTGHPIYSFAALGYRAREFEGVDNTSGYADDSPFGLLKTMDGKIGVLDLDDQGSMTFYHHVEEVRAVDYRYHKAFTGDCTDRNGVTTSRTYTLFVRDLDKGVATHVNPAGELMWKRGLYAGARPGTGSGLRVIRAREMFDFVAALIDGGQALGTLYVLENTGER
ncbi:AAC(3) family N-acetyltransferase [Phaeovibrio sulfidiphilus]|uniref:Aminoglycoside N(3)-acetyltransferase n=1 Tax=Phaeovibrio sulfidiphilus TaxID=1220600 RepID=A0A8J6YNN8_9PROT|nr:AAC(3) family N-acetyltransferase [Phaeovibrio sulfidiphilus]MBE1237960.1 AAC(3) family N-acetyltransferase [Phaeovibrio sulfidiphilus]